MKYVFKLAYNGADFSGFQRQPDKLTVQGHLESVLRQYFGTEIKLSAAGRTDTGVNGLGQVVAFQAPLVPDLGKFCHSVNSMFRAPMALLEAAILDDDDPFHPRHSALSRTYHYLILDECTLPERLFWESRAWCIGGGLHLPSVRSAAALLIGAHDFTTLSYKPDEGMSRVRTVTSLTINEEALPPLFGSQTGRLWRLEITANGFLRRMVRAVTSALVQVGQGLCDEAELMRRLKAKDPQAGPPPAPPQGLYFESVTYDPDPFEKAKQRGLWHQAGHTKRLLYR